MKIPKTLSAIPYVVALSVIWLCFSLWLDDATSNFFIAFVGGGILAALVIMGVRKVVDGQRRRRMIRQRREQVLATNLHLVNAEDEARPRRKPVQNFYREQRSRAAK
jgi:hypothetical protein